MKKRPVKLMAIILCLFMSLSLCGCGTDLTGMLLLKKCGDALSGLDSVSFTVQTDAEAKINKLDMKLSADGNGAWVREPFAVKLDAETTFGKLGKINMPILVGNEGDRLVMYMQLDILREPVWLRSEIGPAFTGAAIDMEKLLDYFGDTEGKISFEQDENEKVYILNADVPTELIRGLSGENLSDMPEYIPVQVKIDMDSYLPLSIRMEAAPLLQVMLERSGLNGSGLVGNIKVESAPLILTVTDTNQVSAIDMPNDMCVIVDITPDRAETEPRTAPEAEAEPAASAKPLPTVPPAPAPVPPEEPTVTEAPAEEASDVSGTEEFYEYIFGLFADEETA